MHSRAGLEAFCMDGLLGLGIGEPWEECIRGPISEYFRRSPIIPLFLLIPRSFPIVPGPRAPSIEGFQKPVTKQYLFSHKVRVIFLPAACSLAACSSSKPYLLRSTKVFKALTTLKYPKRPLRFLRSWRVLEAPKCLKSI